MLRLWLGLGNLRANGHPSGDLWRQLQCTSCAGYFLETHGTIFHGKQVAVGLIVYVLACVAEGLGIRATARVFEVDPNTVLRWLVCSVRASSIRIWTISSVKSGAETLSDCCRGKAATLPRILEAKNGLQSLQEVVLKE
jgi:hypothetical protein